MGEKNYELQAETLSSLYQMIGSLVSNPKFGDPIMASQIVAKSVENLQTELKAAINSNSQRNIVEMLRLTVDFLRGFTTKVQINEIKACFWEQLQVIQQFAQMSGMNSVPAIQAQLTKYIER